MMKPFREPFSMETAEGFPVGDLLPSSASHARNRDVNAKPGENARKQEKISDPGSKLPKH